MRIVLNSNIIITAFATRGLCHAVFEICLDRHEIILSSFLLKEIESNFVRKLKLLNNIREMKFKTPDDLSQQIKKDLEKAKDYFRKVWA